MGNKYCLKNEFYCYYLFIDLEFMVRQGTSIFGRKTKLQSVKLGANFIDQGQRSL